MAAEAQMPVRKIVIHANVNLFPLAKARDRAAIDVTPSAAIDRKSAT